MSYRHILNLYRPEAQTILLLKEAYALEKIHGTSASVAWREGRVWFSPGGEAQTRFRALFDEAALAVAFAALGHPGVIVHGEAYGGSQQGQAWRYGPALRFVAFDVRIGDHWLAVPAAESVVANLGLEFVHYVKIPTDIRAIDAERDAPSVQARRNGVFGAQPREGVVLRPLVELTTNNGERVIAKHKRAEERETKTEHPVDPAQRLVLEEANAIADEWVTPTRLAHVLDKLPPDVGIEQMRTVISAMLDDVRREGCGEFVDSKDARIAISRRVAALFTAHLQDALNAQRR